MSDENNCGRTPCPDKATKNTTRLKTSLLQIKNFRLFKLYRVYLDQPNLSNVGDFWWD